MVKIKQWLKDRLKELSIVDPNSADGFRERARSMICKGTPADHPYVSMLVKRALLIENKEFPEPLAWELMSAEEKENWVLKQLGMELPKKA